MLLASVEKSSVGLDNTSIHYKEVPWAPMRTLGVAGDFGFGVLGADTTKKFVVCQSPPL